MQEDYKTAGEPKGQAKDIYYGKEFVFPEMAKCNSEINEHKIMFSLRMLDSCQSLNIQKIRVLKNRFANNCWNFQQEMYAFPTIK